MPHRLHQVAGILKDMDLSDAPHLDQHQLRSVVNRAYYAAFISARDFCDGKGYHASGKGMHDSVVNALLAQPGWTTEGNRLKQIKTLRHDADYHWEKTMTWRDATTTLKKSRQIIEALSES